MRKTVRIRRGAWWTVRSRRPTRRGFSISRSSRDSTSGKQVILIDLLFDPGETAAELQSLRA